MSTSRVGFAVARRTAGRATLSALIAVTALATGSTGCDTLRARARAQKGVEKYRDGDIKGAAALFREAAEIDPTVPPIILNRGFTHLQLYQQSPRSKEGAEAANIAIASFKDYMKLPDLTPAQVERARDYLLQTFVDARRYDDAVEYFKPQTERENPDAMAMIILGNIAKSVGKTEDARRWVERRVKANPKDTDGFVTLATMDWDELCNDSQCRIGAEQRKNQLQMPPDKRWEKANHGIDLLKKAIELSPQSPAPAMYAGLLLRERQWAAATDDFKRADLDAAVALSNLVTAMNKAAGAAGKTGTPAPAAPTDGGTPPDLAPPSLIKVWKTSEALQAVTSINTTMPPPCPVAPPVNPKARKAPPPPPAPTTVCIPSWYPGMLPPAGVTSAIVYPSTVPADAPAPTPAVAPAPAPTPAPAAAPTPAPKPAAPAPKPAAPAPAAPKPAATPAPKPAAPAAPAPAKPKPAPAAKPADKPAQPNSPTPPKVVVDEDGEN